MKKYIFGFLVAVLILIIMYLLKDNLASQSFLKGSFILTDETQTIKNTNNLNNSENSSQSEEEITRYHKANARKVVAKIQAELENEKANTNKYPFNLGSINNDYLQNEMAQYEINYESNGDTYKLTIFFLDGTSETYPL